VLESGCQHKYAQDRRGVLHVFSPPFACGPYVPRSISPGAFSAPASARLRVAGALAASRAADVIERTWLAWALERPAEPARIEAALARVGEHYQEVLADPLVRDAVVGQRTGLALWHRPDDRLRWPLWAPDRDICAAWTAAPTGWRSVIGEIGPAAASAELARKLLADPDRLSDLIPPFALGAFVPESEELVIVTDALGATRLYELRTEAGAVWSNRLGALPLFAGRRPEADPRGWQILAAAGWFLGPWTSLRGARKVRGGSIVRVRPRGDRLEIERSETSARDTIASPREATRERAVADAAEAAVACAADVARLWSAPLTVDLSGGRDSRIAAAAALAAPVEAEYLTLDAGPGELDLVQALVRASRRPMPQAVRAPDDRPAAQELPERLRLYHHHHDGMASPEDASRRAVERLHRGYGGPALSGDGGEVGHGLYYPTRAQRRSLRGKGMTRMVRRLVVLARKGGAARPEAYRAYRAEVERTLAEGQSFGVSGPRLLDYFLLAERLPNRSGLGERSDRYSPCCTPAFLRAGLELRPRERLDLALHRAIIERLAPEWTGVPFFAGARADLDDRRSWEHERDAAWLERMILQDLSWHELFEPGAVRQRWQGARAGLGTAHHERLFLRIAWRATFEEHLALLARRAGGEPLL
jgi:hypothetical protein